MKIIGYCDFSSKDFLEQLNTATNLNINNIFLRYFDDKLIYELENEDIKSITSNLKQTKKEIAVLDPLIASYDLYDTTKYEETIELYEKTFLVANKLKVNKVFLRLPIVKDILAEFETLETQLTPLLELAKKQKIALIIYPQDEKTNSLVYILKKYRKRDISVIFNPVQIVKNGESPIVAYRLLKDHFNFFVAADLDKKNNPELLGYGRVKIIDLFKRLNRDNYQGDIVLDQNFSDFVTPESTKKVPWFKRLFNKNENINNYLTGYASRIFPDVENAEVTILDIYENQIGVLKIALGIKN